MCRFDMSPSRSNKKGGKMVVLAAMASGTKLPAVIIFKECGGFLGVNPVKSSDSIKCESETTANR